MLAHDQPASSRADLHAHTRWSDGLLEPDALVVDAHVAGLRAIAITDHDTTAAIEPARLAALNFGILVVAGIELSCELDGLEVHLLGYGFEPEHEELRATIARQLLVRRQRAERMLERLRRLGLELELEHPLGPAAALGRPHLAAALERAGHCRDRREAFERYLGRQGSAYVARELLPARRAIAVLHQAHGFAVVAHPGRAIDRESLVALARAGLDGLEVAHPSHTEDLERKLRKFAAQHDLMCTGGSDFHGPPALLGRPVVSLAVAERLAAGRHPSQLRAAGA
jgi:hypothetical protein